MPNEFKKLIDDKKLSTESLMVLEKLDRLGSFIDAANGDTRTAERYIRQIALLEKYCHFPLIERTGKGVFVTVEGSELARAARDLFRGINDGMQCGPDRQLNYVIGAGESLLHWVVIPGLEKVTQVSPEAALRLSNLQNNDIVHGLLAHTLDFGLLREDSLKNAALDYKYLGDLDYVLGVPEPLWKVLKEVQADDYYQAMMSLPLAVHLETAHVQIELERALEKKGITARNFLLRADTFPSLAAALSTGKYAVLMIRFCNQARNASANPAKNMMEAHPRSFLMKYFDLPEMDHLRRRIFLAWLPRQISRRPDWERLRDALIAHLSWGQDPRAKRSRP